MTSRDKEDMKKIEIETEHISAKIFTKTNKNFWGINIFQNIKILKSVTLLTTSYRWHYKVVLISAKTPVTQATEKNE